VSAPFHCALMAPAARVVEGELSRVVMRDPRFPIVANFDAQPNTSADRAKELLVRQVDGAVRWEATVRHIVANGVKRGCEIGPGKVLAGLIKRTAKELEILSVGDAASLEKVGSFLSQA
jgi:[acyl-carrier-protein] S-malonyltransferase